MPRRAPAFTRSVSRKPVLTSSVSTVRLPCSPRHLRTAEKRGLILKTVQADWRELNRVIHGKYDAIICLGNSFTHLHDEQDRRKALAEFYAALRHDGILILDQRNYDEMLDHGFTSKHKYYYCGDQVTAEPEYIDDGLARFRYTFPDGCEYTLNMFPLRKNYVRRLMREAGFELCARTATSRRPTRRASPTSSSTLRRSL